MEIETCTHSHDQMLRTRNLLYDGKLTPQEIIKIMHELKPNQCEKIILRYERVRQLLPKDLSVSKREEYIIPALVHYANAIAL